MNSSYGVTFIWRNINMSVNMKVIKVLNKLFDAGFCAEKEIAVMNLDDMLGIQGISVPEISIINDLQKSIKSGSIIAYLAERKENDE